MGYLSKFKHDLFLSYAWVDNAVYREKEEGWVTRFYKALKTCLDQRIGDSDSIQIWWDKDMPRYKRFDNEIKEAIENSAFFITFGSNGYYKSPYCLQELKWFAEQREKILPGTGAKNNGRIFNVLLYKKPFAEWPPECRGTNAYEMFELKYEGDRYGSPVNPDSNVFVSTINRLSDEIFESLSAMAEQDQPDVPVAGPERAEQPRLKVFVARTTDTLLKQKEQLIKELEDSNIEVVPKDDLPPPYERSEHEEAVKNLLQDTCLSVHLFDGVPGDLMVKGQPHTFSQEQAILAKKMNKNQLIFIPKDLDFDTVKNEHHKNFLLRLQNEKKEADKYTLIREFALPYVLREIKEKISEASAPLVLPGEGCISDAAFLDFHEQDYNYAFEMANLLAKNNIKAFFSKYRNDPKENITNYKEQLKEATKLIVICGKDIRDRVRERLFIANETVLREECPIDVCGVYLPPKVQNTVPIIPRSVFHIEYLDDSRNLAFNPNTVTPFIKKFFPQKIA